ncbi:hypothetical protein GF337_19830 [candidate division KSB1 bacterium]|nr:hypothetical protein [candidate division KSB1 bacterium]
MLNNWSNSMPKGTKDKKRNRTVKKNDMVLLRYTARLKDGTIVGSNKDDDPLKINLERDDVHNAIKLRLVGMKEGESQIITVVAKNAFGKRKKKLLYNVDKDKLQNHDLKTGDFLKIQNPEGEIQTAKVSNISDSKVTLDANHHLAGNDIIYEIELIEILS